MKDLNQIVKIEKAIAQKYGEDTIANPKHYWNEDKEKEYVEQLKELSALETKQQEKDQKINIDGIFISKKLLNKESNVVVVNTLIAFLLLFPSAVVSLIFLTVCG